MDLTQLRYFQRVAECSSFTQAAAKCAITQPALSQQIAKLEKEFGQPLFARTSRNVALTAAGSQLLEYTEKILQLVDDAKRHITDNGQGGRLQIAFVPDLSRFLLSNLLPVLRAEFPDTEILVTEQPMDILIKRCERGEFDLLFQPAPYKSSPELQMEELFSEEICLLAKTGHPLLDRKELQLPDLGGQKLVLLNDYHSLTRWLIEVLGERQIKIRTSARVDQVSTLWSLVENGSGVSLLPASLLPDPTVAGLVSKPIESSRLRRRIAMCWHAERYQTQLVTNLMKAIRATGDPECQPIKRESRSGSSKRIVVK